MASHKTFQIHDSSDTTIGIAITELPGVRAENLGLKTWGAAFVLSEQLHALYNYYVKPHTSTKNKASVLEIGAGTGLTGVAAAVVWQSHVILTDLPSIVDALHANIVLNEQLLKQRHAQLDSATLDWFNPKQIYLRGSAQPLESAEHKFQVILAADTIYSDDHPRLMAATIFEWLARDRDACFIVCYAQRIAYLDYIRELWTLLEDGGLRAVEDGLQRGDASWDEEAPFEWAVFKWKQFLPQT